MSRWSAWTACHPARDRRRASPSPAARRTRASKTSSLRPAVVLQRAVAPLDGAGEPARRSGRGRRGARGGRGRRRRGGPRPVRVRWAMRRVSGSGAWRSRKPSSETNVPSPMTESRNAGDRVVGLVEQRLQRGPPADGGQRRASAPVIVARRVNTSMWRASSATVTARTCWISRKWGWTWPRKRAGTTSAASSFSTRNVMTCTTASSTRRSWPIGASSRWPSPGPTGAAAAWA